MSFLNYIKDKRIVLLICFAGSLFFFFFLLFLGIGIGELLLLWICFTIIAFCTVICDYLQQKKRIEYLLSVLELLEKKYLIAEIADKPDSILEQVYFQIMKAALKAMTDEVVTSKRLNSEYRDFVEQWVHEIKVPITGIQLICENDKTNTTRKIMIQAKLIEQSVEQVLFYARLGSVEKDYLIKEVFLKDCVMEVLAQNKQFLIQNNVCVHTENIFGAVYSDNKWIEFILSQIISNSIKYQGKQSLVIDIASENIENYVVLSITDNGIGIKESEISRVFDKGFVGSNGRSGKNATGMGLYICAQLCDKLGIDIKIKSERNQFTMVCLHFPKNTHLNQ